MNSGVIAVILIFNGLVYAFGGGKCNVRIFGFKLPFLSVFWIPSFVL